MKANPKHLEVLEKYKRVRAELDEKVQHLTETYNSFPFKDVEAYHKNKKESDEMERNLIQQKVDQKSEHINELYNSLDLGKFFFKFYFNLALIFLQLSL